MYIGCDGSTTDLRCEPAAYSFDRLLGGNIAEPPSRPAATGSGPA